MDEIEIELQALLKRTKKWKEKNHPRDDQAPLSDHTAIDDIRAFLKTGPGAKFLSLHDFLSRRLTI